MGAGASVVSSSTTINTTINTTQDVVRRLSSLGSDVLSNSLSVIYIYI